MDQYMGRCDIVDVFFDCQSLITMYSVASFVVAEAALSLLGRPS